MRLVLLEELLDVDLLARHVKAGLVSKRVHPTEPLHVLNYTAACQYERAWDDVTRQCRGLVYREPTLEVVARPWPKFYNYGEHVEVSSRAASDEEVKLDVVLGNVLDLDARVEVSDKLDGSLGILYPVREGQWAIATRGSFDSDQARWAGGGVDYEGSWAWPSPSSSASWSTRSCLARDRCSKTA